MGLAAIEPVTNPGWCVMIAVGLAAALSLLLLAILRKRSDNAPSEKRMNNLEKYESILNKYFGPGSARFDTGTGISNEILGALNHTQFASFRGVFLNRCKRLAALYPGGDPNRKPLLDRLNEMASASKWDGVYAEMAALDFLNSDQDWLSAPINLSKTVPATETLAGRFGGSSANWDGYYDDFDVCFDVKVLGDKTGNILDGIFKEVTSSLGVKGLHISAQYPLDMRYEHFETRRGALRAELQRAIDVQARTALIRSTVVADLSYHLQWEPGVVSTISTYDPYQHAANHHTLLFKHAKKFARNRPSLIVFVIFPWFSEKIVNDFCGHEVFFRAFSRRFFCQYTKDTAPASSLLTSFQGTETLAQVTGALSGVLFLEDTSVLATDTAALNVKGYAYLNPNAAHKVRGRFREHLRTLGCKVDDFSFDNY